MSDVANLPSISASVAFCTCTPNSNNNHNSSSGGGANNFDTANHSDHHHTSRDPNSHQPPGVSRNNSDDGGKLSKLSNKNDSFLSLGTGSDLYRGDGEFELASNHSAGSCGNDNDSETERRSGGIPLDDESGRFTEQESMDIINDEGTQYDEHEEQDSDNEVIQHLRMELEKAKKELRAKNEKCEKLSEMQNIVDSEIHELTASLFQEAYKMVADANQKRHLAEKLLKESNGKVDVLEAEVEALKTLVLTSTPSAPNRHLHPQLCTSSKKPPLGSSTSKTSGLSSFLGHKRNHSDNTGSACSVHTTSKTEDLKEQRFGSGSGSAHKHNQQQREFREIDPNYYREFTSWREKLDPRDKSHAFLKRVYEEEIMPCLNFSNSELSDQILTSIEENTIIVEQIGDEKPVARICALLQMPCMCNYRLKLDNNGEWTYVSVLCRNRIAAVCDFLTYLRYMQQGLVKCGICESYWEIIRLRKNMALARLGLGLLHAA